MNDIRDFTHTHKESAWGHVIEVYRTNTDEGEVTKGVIRTLGSQGSLRRFDTFFCNDDALFDAYHTNVEIRLDGVMENDDVLHVGRVELIK